jgi:hypothetical protein
MIAALRGDSQALEFDADFYQSDDRLFAVGLTGDCCCEVRPHVPNVVSFSSSGMRGPTKKPVGVEATRQIVGHFYWGQKAWKNLQIETRLLCDGPAVSLETTIIYACY